jgi:cation:H+ antiporter
MSPWLVFALSAAAVILAGIRLSRDGDTIAERTGLGGAWVGAILIAGATSLPELATDIFAVRMGERSLAVGDLFGSNMANMLILAVADLSVRNVLVLSRVTVNQVLVGVLAIILTVIATIGIISPVNFGLLGAGWATLLLGTTYLFGMRLLHVNRGESAFESGEAAAKHASSAPPLRNAVIGFMLAAAVILFAARYLAGSTAHIAAELGLASGFAGMVLLALTTSLPEVAVTVAAVRCGSYDLAVGNLLGSNAFNMAILLVLDFVDGPQPLLTGLQPGLLLGALFSILLMGQVLLGILNRSEKRVWFLEPDALFLIATYGLGLWLVYQAGGH